MNDDSRLQNPLGPEAQAILEAGREADNPRDSDRARVGRALLKRVATAGAVGAGASLFASSAAATPLVKSVLLPALLVVAGGLMGGAVVWSTRPLSLPPATVMAPAAVPPVAPPVSQPPAIEDVPALAAPAEAPRAAQAQNQLARETALLAEVTVALRTGDPRRGLRLLDTYQRRFPAGVLREEMRGARILARCQLADASQPAARASAREVARGFLRAYPASPLAPRIRKACETPLP